MLAMKAVGTIIATAVVVCLILGTYVAVPPARADQEMLEEGMNGQPVLWQEPTDLEKRDLFYGIGGRQGAPNPTDKFLFKGRDPHGMSEKIFVEDQRDRRWTAKFGLEARPETVATRIVWAAGFHVDQDYFLRRAWIEGRNFEARDVRFERDDDGFKKVARWSWHANPFVGTRELDGLKVLMALLNNFDLKSENNKIVRPGKKSGRDPNKLIYYVSDLGATLGTTGYWFTQNPIGGLFGAGTKGIPENFAAHPFIDGVKNCEVLFHNKRSLAKQALAGVKVDNARWMGDLLARLSDKQFADAFRAGGFDERETAIYLAALRDRIRQLQDLK